MARFDQTMRIVCSCWILLVITDVVDIVSAKPTTTGTATINSHRHRLNKVGSSRHHRKYQSDYQDYPADFRWPESYFDLEASSDVAVVVGQTAFLVCRVAVAGNWTVSWVGPDHPHNNRNVNLLTVGTDTYTPDRRFRGLHVPNSPEWTLQIKATTLDDAGNYECQLSSTPLKTHVIRLRIIEPHIQILNGPEVYVHEGSMLNLTCVISPAVDASLLLWSRNGQDLSVLIDLWQSVVCANSRP